MAIKNAYMMTFRCDACSAARPYGEANGSSCRPSNIQPRLQCGACEKTTPHSFSGVEKYRMTYDRSPSGAIANVQFSTAA